MGKDKDEKSEDKKNKYEKISVQLDINPKVNATEKCTSAVHWWKQHSCIGNIIYLIFTKTVLVMALLNSHTTVYRSDRIRRTNEVL